MSAEQLPLTRLRQLLEQLMEEHPDATKTRIASTMGLSPSMVSKLLGDARAAPSAETIGRVTRSLNLDPSFFYDDDELDPPPHYRDYIRGRRAAGPAPACWADFQANWTRFGELTVTEREALQALVTPAHRVDHWTEWVAPAEWILDHRR